MPMRSVDSDGFKRILQRNVGYPLVICISMCIVFVVLFMHMISLSRWVNHTNKVIAKSYETMKLVIDAETGVRGYALTKDEAYLEPYNIAISQLDSHFEELSEMVEDESTQIQQVKLLHQLYKNWQQTTKGRLSLKNKDLTDVIDVRKTMMDSLRTEFRRFIVYETRLRDQRTEDVQAQSQTLLFVTIAVSLLAGGFLALSGRRQILSLSENYEKSLEKQNIQNEELAEQSWHRAGQANLAMRVKGELSLEEIGKNALEFFNEYFGSVVGTFFASEDNGALRRVATYGFSASTSPSAKEKFESGEGIVGSVAESRKIFRLSELPNDYIKFTSSLGHSAPTELIVLPVVAGGVLEGVLELGHTRSFTEKEENLLSEVAEILGTAVKSAIYRSKLQNYIEEMQVQAEELQAQQEELKVSNEELAERSRSLAMTQQRLESQHAELEQTNTELESQKQLLDEQNQYLRDTQKELERKSHELEESSRYKSEFLANMSHELRTPLNSTLILSKLLRDNPKGNLTNEQVEFAGTIYSAGNDLLNLINDILDLSKVEAGKLEVYTEKFKIDDLLKGVGNLFKPITQQKGIELKLTKDPSSPEFMVTDRMRLEQVLKNLLSNAVKFTSRGSVGIEVSSPKPGLISLAVHDTGIGIKPEQMETIFEAFRQADGTTNRKYGGTGLGLTISRNLSKLLGGDIHVESKPNEGSKFILTLPVVPNEELKQMTIKDDEHHIERRPKIDLTPSETIQLAEIDDDLEKMPAKGKKVLLIVEDEKTFAEILVKVSREQKFLCLVAQTCQQAFKLAMEHVPDAIILDMKLPDGLGLALLDQLKETPKTRHIPVHVISSADFSREALHLGAVGYLKKPSEIDDIKKSIGKLEEKINQKMKRVLVVEDDEVQRMAIEKLIGDKGVEITAVSSGMAAFEKMKENVYDCAIVDLLLSDVSGFKLLEMMREQSEFLAPPVIIYTGRSLTTEEEQNLRQYSRSIIIKGAKSPERLLSEVTLFLHQVESQMSEEKRSILQVSRNYENDFEDRTVLLVDDDARNIFALMSMLESKGAKVVVARNGREALDMVNKHPEVSLVLMDIMMPEMDGHQATRELRRRFTKDELPIITLTAKAMRDDYDQCIESGANDYLAKPVNVDKLVSLMRVWMQRS